jgi:hypothetical protein
MGNLFFKNENKSLDLKFIIAMAIIVILIIMKIDSCNSRKLEDKIRIQNEAALKNELVVEKNKVGKLQTSTAVYMGKMNDLSKYSEELQKEVDNLKNRKPKVIIKTELVYVGDTTEVASDIDSLGEGEYSINWKYQNEDSTRFLEGNSYFFAKYNVDHLTIIPRSTFITRDDLVLNLTVGLVHNNETKLDEIFVTPDNPNVHISKLKGAELPPSLPKKYGIGFSGGFGVIYNPVTNSFNLGPFIGIGISRNIIRF